MIRFAYTETIAASPADVFAVMSDIRRFDQWLDMDGRPHDRGPVRVGSRFSSTSRMGPLRVESEGEITHAERGRRFGFRVVNPRMFEFEILIDLEPGPDGSTTMKGRGSMQTLRLWRLLEPLLRAEVQRGEAREAARLRAVVEGGRRATMQATT